MFFKEREEDKHKLEKMLRHYEETVANKFQEYNQQMQYKLEDLENEINNNVSKAMEESVSVTTIYLRLGK